MLRKCAFLAAFVLIGCSKSHPSKGGHGPFFEEDFYAIPEKVQVEAASFPAITDEQYAAAKDLLGTLHTINSLRPHVLIDPDETDSSKELRDEAFAQLTPAQKSAVGVLNTRCEISEEPADPKKFMASEINMIEELRTTGAHCPAVLSNRTQLKWTVLNTDEKGESGAVRVEVHNTLHSEYAEPDLADAAGSTKLHVETRARGRMEIYPDGSKTYARLRGGGFAELTDARLGHMDIRVRGEFLEQEYTSRELVLYVDLFIKQNTYTMAFHCSQDEDGVIHVDKFYIGDRVLSDKEMEESRVTELARLLLQ